MIVKKVPKMKAGGGSFGGLANYLLDIKNNNEKVEGFEFSNCSFGDDVQYNLQEIASTQKVNTNTKSDKTYHLIVSFREDENPTPEVIKAIEDELAKSLGFENHQRLSVVHGNTNNLHVHIAINRIDPETFKCKDPFRDIPTLHKKAVELEERYRLKRDNHTAKNREPVKIKDKEIHSGVQSFLTWIKETALPEIKEVIKEEKTSLEDLQRVLNKYNLELRERGAGVVISDKERALYVKASNVDRALSKNNLIKRFGEFKPIHFEEKSTTKFGHNKTSLWSQYQEQTQQIRNDKKALFSSLSKEAADEFQNLKIEYARRRNLIQVNPKLNKYVKREAYRLLGQERAKEFKALKNKLTSERTAIYEENKFHTFTDFLQEKAAAGDPKALSSLKRKNVSVEQFGDVIESENGTGKHKLLPGQKVQITKSGIVFYKIDGGKIIDTGNALKLSGVRSETNLREFLDLAKIKFGALPVIVKGTKQFKEATKESSGTVGKINFTKEDTKSQTFDQIKKRIGEKHNARRGEFTASHDQSRWKSFTASTRAYFGGAREQLENVISDYRNSSLTSRNAINERIADMQSIQNRSIGSKEWFKSNTITTTTTNRGRDTSLQAANGKDKPNDRIKEGGLKR
ncbi:MAG: TraI/MobA(P) family conjugative relaxase [Bacilli bacterium]|nr:TraI/MobA(P) family conjugative relaxase [Bacilli bacterium]